MTYGNSDGPGNGEDTEVPCDITRKKELTLFVTDVTLTASLGSAEVHHVYRTLPCFSVSSGNMGTS